MINDRIERRPTHLNYVPRNGTRLNGSPVAVRVVNGNGRSNGNGSAPAKPDRYKSYALNNYRDLPQVQKYLTEEQRFAIEVVARVLPFKTNSYVVNELINWEDVPNDPIFVLNFPLPDMLLPHHFDKMAALVRRGAEKHESSGEQQSR